MKNTEYHTQQYAKQRRFARECALQFLYQLDLQNEWKVEKADIDHFWQRVVETEQDTPLKTVEKAQQFANELIEGVVNNEAELDRILEQAAQNWQLSRMSVVDRNILRIAAYELCMSKRETPAGAVVNEAVELAKMFGDKDSSRFVNGVADRLMHRKSD